MPDTVSIERAGASEELLQKLRGMGHTVNAGERAGGAQGDANSIGVDAGGTAWGASDKRSPDGKTSVARLTSTASRQ
jgi:gamma-glutamyltranspeptidase